VAFFNFLASHDGIGLNPLRGILPEDEIDQVVQRVLAHGGLVSFKSDLDGNQRPYELNINYFDALNNPAEDDLLEVQVDRFVTAHAILLSMQGVPGIYFHSLFGSCGWPEGVRETGRNRTINRRKFDKTEIEARLDASGTREAIIFRRLSRLLDLRSRHPAFHPFGSQQVLNCAPGVFALLRAAPDDGERMLCLQNVSNAAQSVRLDLKELPGGRNRTRRDIIMDDLVFINGSVILRPYQTLWLI
jgi:sucrose phosphorylase